MHVYGMVWYGMAWCVCGWVIPSCAGPAETACGAAVFRDRCPTGGWPPARDEQRVRHHSRLDVLLLCDAHTAGDSVRLAPLQSVAVVVPVRVWGRCIMMQRHGGSSHEKSRSPVRCVRAHV